MNLHDNYIDLSIALRGEDKNEMISELKKSIDYMTKFKDGIIRDMKPTVTLEIRPGNINGQYVNLPSHISTADLLSRMNLVIDGQFYDEADIALIHQVKLLSNNLFNAPVNRFGGYYILLKDLK